MVFTLKGMPAPETGEASYLAPNAAIAGDVKLGKNTSVWFSASVRGDGHPIRTGHDCNIQDNAVLHADEEYDIVLGNYVSVGHAAVVHGCHLDDYVLVGMNATVLNGAHVGEGCLIAAGALVTEHAEIPPYSLVVGVPGKVKGPLTPAQLEYVKSNWTEYQHLSGLYAQAEEH